MDKKSGAACIEGLLDRTEGPRKASGRDSMV